MQREQTKRRAADSKDLLNMYANRDVLVSSFSYSA